MYIVVVDVVFVALLISYMTVAAVKVTFGYCAIHSKDSGAHGMAVQFATQFPVGGAVMRGL